MSGITKKEAHIIAAYGYQLVDKEGKEYSITKVSTDEYGNTYFYYKESSTIPADLIGTEFFIHCLPYEALTKEVEGIGVPIEYFEIGDDGGYKFEFDHGNVKLIRSLKTISEHSIYYDVNYLPIVIVDQLHKWHFPPHGIDKQCLKFKEV